MGKDASAFRARLKQAQWKQESGGESFAYGAAPRSEDVRIIYNAPKGAGVVHE